MTDSVVKDILIGTVGSLIAASLAWLVALIARSKKPLQDERQPAVLAALIPDIGDLAAASPRGPLWQSGRHGLLIATLGLSILVAIADIPSPPFGLPPLMRFMSAGTGQSYRDLLYEADKMLRDAQWEEERLLRAAQFEVESIMNRAAWEENSLRERGQAGAAQRVMSVSEERARLTLERATKQGDVLLETARRKAAALVDQSSREMPSSRTSVYDVRGTIVRILATLFRSLAVFALAAFALRVWYGSSTSRAAVTAVSVVAVALGIGSVVGDVSVFEFFVPLFVAGAVVGARRAAFGTGQVVAAAFYLIYERFGHAILLVCLQLAVAVSAALGSAAVGHAIGSWLDEPEPATAVVLSHASETAAAVAAVIGSTFGFELARCLAAVSFVSVLMGRDRSEQGIQSAQA